MTLRKKAARLSATARSGQKDEEMAREYHNLQGLVRDLRAATLAASEGDSKAQDLVNALDDALELHDAYCAGDLDGGQDSDADASGDDAEDESDGGASEQPSGAVGRVRDMGRSPITHSTRARVRAEQRPGPRSVVASTVGTVQTVGAAAPASTRARGRR